MANIEIIIKIDGQYFLDSDSSNVKNPFVNGIGIQRTETALNQLDKIAKSF